MQRVLLLASVWTACSGAFVVPELTLLSKSCSSVKLPDGTDIPFKLQIGGRGCRSRPRVTGKSIKPNVMTLTNSHVMQNGDVFISTTWRYDGAHIPRVFRLYLDFYGQKPDDETSTCMIFTLGKKRNKISGPVLFSVTCLPLLSGEFIHIRSQSFTSRTSASDCRQRRSVDAACGVECSNTSYILADRESFKGELCQCNGVLPTLSWQYNRTMDNFRIRFTNVPKYLSSLCLYVRDNVTGDEVLLPLQKECIPGGDRDHLTVFTDKLNRSGSFFVEFYGKCPDRLSGHERRWRLKCDNFTDVHFAHMLSDTLTVLPYQRVASVLSPSRQHEHTPAIVFVFVGLGVALVAAITTAVFVLLHRQNTRSSSNTDVVEGTEMTVLNPARVTESPTDESANLMPSSESGDDNIKLESSNVTKNRFSGNEVNDVDNMVPDVDTVQVSAQISETNLDQRVTETETVMSPTKLGLMINKGNAPNRACVQQHKIAINTDDDPLKTRSTSCMSDVTGKSGFHKSIGGDPTDCTDINLEHGHWNMGMNPKMVTAPICNACCVNNMHESDIERQRPDTLSMPSLSAHVHVPLVYLPDVKNEKVRKKIVELSDKVSGQNIKFHLISNEEQLESMSLCPQYMCHNIVFVVSNRTNQLLNNEQAAVDPASALEARYLMSVLNYIRLIASPDCGSVSLHVVSLQRCAQNGRNLISEFQETLNIARLSSVIVRCYNLYGDSVVSQENMGELSTLIDCIQNQY